jgi:hypothetical protein
MKNSCILLALLKKETARKLQRDVKRKVKENHRTDSVHFFGLQERKFASLSRQGPKGGIVNRDGASSCNARIEGSVICRYLPIPCGYWAVSKPTVNDLFTVTDRGGNES